MNHFIVATEREEPVGFALAYELNRLDRPQPMMLLYEISVAENRRRQGVAKAMINFLKTMCREKSVMKMWTLTNESNQAAVRTYQSTGGKFVPEDDMAMCVYVPESFAQSHEVAKD